MTPFLKSHATIIVHVQELQYMYHTGVSIRPLILHVDLGQKPGGGVGGGVAFTPYHPGLLHNFQHNLKVDENQESAFTQYCRGRIHAPVQYMYSIY